MSGLPSPRRRHRIVALATLAALIGAALLAWLLFWPAPHLPCRLEHGAMRAPSPLASLTLSPLPAVGGLVVTSLRSHGPAERRGVRVGDVVETIDGRGVRNLDGLGRILRADSRPVVSVRMRGAKGRYEVMLTRTAQACHDP